MVLIYLIGLSEKLEQAIQECTYELVCKQMFLTLRPTLITVLKEWYLLLSFSGPLHKVSRKKDDFKREAGAKGRPWTFSETQHPHLCRLRAFFFFFLKKRA